MQCCQYAKLSVLLNVNDKQISQFLSFARPIIKVCTKNSDNNKSTKLQDLMLTYVILKLKLWKEKGSGYNLYVD